MKTRRWRSVFAILLALAMVFALVGCGGSGDSEEPEEEAAVGEDVTVEAPTGTYIGQDNDGVAEFLGISYADPIERWKAPTDVTTTTEDQIEAKEWGPSCIQPDDDVELASGWEQSEDCLDLNIWTRDPATTGKPVMMFIHGGGAWQGGTWDPLYDGEYFIRSLPEGEDAIMITINYRLGIFGSLNMSSLEGYTDEYADAINLAILDQTQALKWINENIESFGGDPENVTIFGQSAGGGAVSTLMTMPEANQYFQKVIMESGTLLNRQISVEKSLENSEAAFEIMGVESVDDLMALEDSVIQEEYVADIMDELGTPQRVSDGRIIPEDGYQALLDGVAKDIDVMIGTTDGEYDFYATDWDNFPEPITDPEYIWGKIVSNQEKGGGSPAVWSVADNQAIVDEYLALEEDQVKRTQDLYNDTQYRQSSIFVAEALTQHNENLYMYYWTWAPDGQDVIDDSGDSAEVSPWNRAMHCMEVVFAFGTIEEGYPELAGPGDKIPMNLVEMTQSAWFNFAKTGDPNNDTIPTWEKYNTDTRQTMIMGDEWALESDPRSEDRLVLDKARP